MIQFCCRWDISIKSQHFSNVAEYSTLRYKIFLLILLQIDFLHFVDIFVANVIGFLYCRKS